MAVDRDALSIDDMEKRKRDKEGPDSMISLAVSCDATGDLIISVIYDLAAPFFGQCQRYTVCVRVREDI